VWIVSLSVGRVKPLRAPCATELESRWNRAGTRGLM
jgi:hypothetical protein